MKILITGGTGFIGSRLSKALISSGNDLIILTRNLNKGVKIFSNQARLIHNLAEIEDSEKLNAIINLAGESIGVRHWTKSQKDKILNSRIKITADLVELIKRLKSPPNIFISASAIGYYGAANPDLQFSEASSPGNDFLASVCKLWEKTAKEAEQYSVPVVLLRNGLVLGDQGALPKMALPFKFFAGNYFGNGRQVISWIHLDDLVEIILFILHHPQVEGSINAVAPEPVSNYKFMKILGKVLKRPLLLPVPAFTLKIFLGEMSTLLLDGQKVYPEKLIQAGYKFRYPDLNSALKKIFSN